MSESTKKSVTYFHNGSSCLKSKHCSLGYKPITNQGAMVAAGLPDLQYEGKTGPYNFTTPLFNLSN